MAYRLDTYDNSLVVDGFEKGMADSPHLGISNMRNVNIISVPGEASVNFATSKISAPSVSGSVTSANAGTKVATFTGAAGIEQGMAIVFSAQSGLNVTTNTVYWVYNVVGSTFQLLTQPNDDVFYVVAITNGTGTFTSYNMTLPKYFANTPQGNYFMVDDSGQAWTDIRPTVSSGYWRFMGNTGGGGTSTGDGLVYYLGYLFLFRNRRIDYVQQTGATGGVGNIGTWTYGWLPATGATGSGSNWMKDSLGVTGYRHSPKVLPNNEVVYCDSNWIGRFYQADPAVTFDPTSTASYIFDQNRLLPSTDQCLSLEWLGNGLLIGGIQNVVYPWDLVSTHIAYPILLPENYVKNIVTVNTTAFLFVGNRGRIYQTNGTSAQLYKKLPDHISGTVEPYYSWGGATYNKNQLYFSASVSTNAGVAINQYGGVWAIDMDTTALRLVNKLSYNTYAGYASAITNNINTNPSGTGLFIGWTDGVSGYGIDTTTSTPYTGSQAAIDSDLIPIGTYTKARDFGKMEFRLTRPLVAGETVVIKSRTVFNTSDTGWTTVIGLTGTTGDFSGIGDANFINAQWLQFQVVLNSTASSPSYVRLKEIRILGLVGPTIADSQTLGL